MSTILIILIGILFASSGQILWKIGMTEIGSISSISVTSIVAMALNPWVVGGLICYGLSTVFWLIALSRADLSYVYPFIALTFVLIFHENISIQRVTGAAIIVAGIIVLVRG
jgi:drug/metabolite transporter (DMT)-like permease